MHLRRRLRRRDAHARPQHRPAPERLLALVLGARIRRALAARRPRGKLHVDHGVRQQVLVAQRQDPPAEVLHDAALRGVQLLAGPYGAAPRGDVVRGGGMRVVEELDGDDEGDEDDELWVDRVDVELGGRCAGGKGVALGGGGGGEGAGEAPGEGELAVEGVEDADGERDGLEGEVRAGEDRLDEGDRGGREGGGGGDEVHEVSCWACGGSARCSVGGFGWCGRLAPSTDVRTAEARDMQVSRGHPSPTRRPKKRHEQQGGKEQKWHDLPRNLGFILCPSSNGFLGLCAADELRLGGGVGRFDSGRYVK